MRTGTSARTAARDHALDTAKRIARATAVGALAVTGGLSFLAARTVKGHRKATAGPTVSAPASPRVRVPPPQPVPHIDGAPPAPRPPAQAPVPAPSEAPAPAPPPAVSGGS